MTSGTLNLGPNENELPPTTQVQLSNMGAASPAAVLAVHANTAIGSLLGGYADAGTITIDPGAVLTVATGDSTYSTQYYAGAIVGDGGVTFTGNGGNRFPGSAEDGGPYVGYAFTYAYAGPTRVEGSVTAAPTVLALYDDQDSQVTSGWIPISPITVAAGGELDLGPGSVVGSLVGAGGTIVPYAGAASSDDAGAAALTLSADTTVRIVYAGPDAGTSFLAVNGAISLGGATLNATSDPSLAPKGRSSSSRTAATRVPRARSLDCRRGRRSRHRAAAR